MRFELHLGVGFSELAVRTVYNFEILVWYTIQSCFRAPFCEAVQVWAVLSISGGPEKLKATHTTKRPYCIKQGIW